MDAQDLWVLEEGFWTGNATFFERHMAADALMVFPAPAGIIQGREIVQAVEAAPRWRNVRMVQRRLSLPSPDAGVLAYEVVAARDDPTTTYRALCSSTYVRTDQDWRLALHQQTPWVEQPAS
jgi:hypothetical protein